MKGFSTSFKFSLIALTAIAIFSACKKKDAAQQEDPRLKYVGEWNFKGTHHYYSGFYIYNPDPTWTFTSTFTYSYDDSTGSISLGENPDQLLVKYCNTCQSLVYNLSENGKGKWTLSETDFFNDVQSTPPSYTPTYTTIKVEGWKL